MLRLLRHRADETSAHFLAMTVVGDCHCERSEAVSVSRYCHVILSRGSERSEETQNLSVARISASR